MPTRRIEHGNKTIRAGEPPDRTQCQGKSVCFVAPVRPVRRQGHLPHPASRATGQPRRPSGALRAIPPRDVPTPDRGPFLDRTNLTAGPADNRDGFASAAAPAAPIRPSGHNGGCPAKAPPRHAPLRVLAVVMRRNRCRKTVLRQIERVDDQRCKQGAAILHQRATLDPARTANRGNPLSQGRNGNGDGGPVGDRYPDKTVRVAGRTHIVLAAEAALAGRTGHSDTGFPCGGDPDVAAMAAAPVFPFAVSGHPASSP